LGTRRRRGSGSPSWHKASQRWLAQVSTPAGRTSKYFPGKPPPAKPPTEAEAWIRQTITAVEQGRFSSAGKRTVADQVAEWYRLQSESGRWSAGTMRTYRFELRHVAPIGPTRLDRLTPQAIQSWLNGLSAAGVGAKSIDMSRNLLSQACAAAVTWGLMASNPVTSTHAPRGAPPQPRQAWSAAEARQFLVAVRGDELEAFWIALLYTGMRQGELRGLRWDKVNLDAGTITVTAALDDRRQLFGPTKTRRSVVLPMAPVLARAIREHRAAQIEMRLAAGPSWQPGDWVFTMPSGKAWTGQTIRNRLLRACAVAELEARVPHEFRHTAVTLMHEAGIPLGVIGAIVGHSTVRITLGTYWHTSEDELRRAMEALESRISG
jgi:integrase